MCICKLTLEDENDSLDDSAVYNWTFVVVISPNANWIKFRHCLRFISIKYNCFVSKQHFNTSCSSLRVCLSLWLLFIAGLANRAFSWTGVSTFFVWNVFNGGQDSLTTMFLFWSSNISVQAWGSLEKKQQDHSGQYKMQTADRVQNANCRLGTNCRLRIYTNFRLIRVNIHLTTYRGSRNCFSAIIFHDYLHYCGIFLARFLIKIILNIISSFHIVFSLCARVGWCDVCTDFTDLMKVDIDVNEMSLLNI